MGHNPLVRRRQIAFHQSLHVSSLVLSFFITLSPLPFSPFLSNVFVLIRVYPRSPRLILPPALRPAAGSPR
jgi:hypothetical protein